jgi:aminoglycoside 6'-N-acetyltransferase I
MDIESCSETNLDCWAAMGLELWPDNTVTNLREDFASTLYNPRYAAFLCRDGGEPVGFINLSLRSDYVEGTSTSPVGYVEGIYVREAFRHRGIARLLLHHGEQWAKAQGCTQMASDCELTNTVSAIFHNSTGFTEANRIVCFVKNLI